MARPTAPTTSSHDFPPRAEPLAATGRRRPARHLSHTDPKGRVQMVDVGPKAETAREAIAVAEVLMSRATLRLVMGRAPGRTAGSVPRRASQPTATGGSQGGELAKGDVLATARVAAIAALKRTADLIPLCHPVRVVGTDIRLEERSGLPGLRIEVAVRAFDRTGVEMEAMVGATTAALTIYDMVKGVERGVEIVSVRLEKKSGGRSGTWVRGEPAAPLVGRGRRASKTARGTSETSSREINRRRRRPPSQPGR